MKNLRVIHQLYTVCNMFDENSHDLNLFSSCELAFLWASTHSRQGSVMLNTANLELMHSIFGMQVFIFISKPEVHFNDNRLFMYLFLLRRFPHECFLTRDVCHCKIGILKGVLRNEGSSSVSGWDTHDQVLCFIF